MDREKRLTGFYSDRETMEPEKRKAHQLERVLEVLQVAWEMKGEVRDRMNRAGLGYDHIQSYADFTSIPPLSKKELIGLQQKDFSSLVRCDLGELSRVYMSPGPLFDPEGRGQDYWGWDEAFYAAGFRGGDLVQMTFSYHLTPAGLMLEEPLRNLGCGVIPAGPGNSEVQMQLLTSLPVTGFVGMTSFLKIIADKAESKGYDLNKDFTLEVAFVAAERLPETLRSEMEQRLSMILRQGYGTADVGCIAYECSQLTGMHLSNRCLVEICEPGTGNPLPPGQPGEVVVTPFNTTYPLIRLATGDLSMIVEDICPCGRTSSRLTGILGRTDMTVKVKGQFIYPHQVQEVMASFPEIAQWQVVITNPGGKDQITVKVEAEAEVDSAGLAAAFQRNLKLKPVVETLPYGQNLPEGYMPVQDERTWE